MASLKEIKERIGSVTGTMKITGAMKMIASVKLHRAQTAIDRVRPYEQQLNGMLSRLLASGTAIDSPLAEPRKEGKTAVVVCSSNSGLCGAFSANVQKELVKYLEGKPKDTIILFPVGKKIREFLEKNQYPVAGNFDALSDKPVYEAAAALAATLIDLYATGKIRQADLIYHHFHNRMSQALVTETYLPVKSMENVEQEEASGNTDYILEPSPEELICLLLPQVLRMKLFAVLLDNNAAEHGARTMAMQQASDNAADLLHRLTIQYNKSRQQSITSELLDIAGGSVG